MPSKHIHTNTLARTRAHTLTNTRARTRDYAFGAGPEQALAPFLNTGVTEPPPPPPPPPPRERAAPTESR